MKARVEAGLEITSTAWQRGKGAFRDLRIRRIGLAVSSLIILVLIAGIIVKIRDYESRNAPAPRADETRGGSRHG